MSSNNLGKRLKKFRKRKLNTKYAICYKHGKTRFYYKNMDIDDSCIKCHEEWLDKQIDKKICTYPEKAKISKNKYSANCYRKIRTAFRDKYIKEKFDNPMQPREKEFFQLIKKYLNTLERQLLKQNR